MSRTSHLWCSGSQDTTATVGASPGSASRGAAPPFVASCATTVLASRQRLSQAALTTRNAPPSGCGAQETQDPTFAPMGWFDQVLMRNASAQGVATPKQILPTVCFAVCHSPADWRSVDGGRLARSLDSSSSAPFQRPASRG